MTLNSRRPPVHALPPMLGAIPTVLGWRHPHTNELLVSVRGLMDDKTETPPPLPVLNTVSNPTGEPPVVLTTESEPPAPADEAIQGTSGEVVITDGVDAPQGAVTPPPAALEIDNSLFKFEKSIDDGVSTVTLRSPNHHAYTKWVVDGVDVEGVKGNTTTIKVGAFFTANNAKGSFHGQSVAV